MSGGSGQTAMEPQPGLNPAVATLSAPARLVRAVPFRGSSTGRAVDC